MNNYSILRVSNDDSRFIELVELLTSELAVIDGDDHQFYEQYNGLEKIKHVVLALDGDLVVGCGAIRPFSDGIMEIKRMYTRQEYRGKGVGSVILEELEYWSKELSCDRCILETGKRQEEAILLYQKNGYHEISNFGPYVGIENSICYEKFLPFC